MFTLTDEMETVTSGTFHTDKQKMHSQADGRLVVLSQKLWCDLLFPEREESASVLCDGGISVGSPQEEWSRNVIYLQASVNVCSQGSTKLR